MAAPSVTLAIQPAAWSPRVAAMPVSPPWPACGSMHAVGALSEFVRGLF